jgi:hypothetical protein
MAQPAFNTNFWKRMSRQAKSREHSGYANLPAFIA